MERQSFAHAGASPLNKIMSKPVGDRHRQVSTLTLNYHFFNRGF